jgi:hypothetical protein
MADYLPYIQGVPPFSGVTASATVTGGQILESTGVNTVGPAGANSVKVVGVAAHDAAVGAGVTVHPIPGNIHETVSTAGSAAGDRLTAAAAGAVATTAAATAAAAGTDIGVAINTATAGNKVRWAGR